MSYWYHIYGLDVHSEIELPELAAIERRPQIHTDVTIRSGVCPLSAAECQMPRTLVRYRENEAAFYFPRYGVFVVRAGREIVYEPQPPTEVAELRPFLLGIVMGILLIQRGFSVLHGSTVAINNCGVTFVGYKGAGKSTTVAGLVQRGGLLVADDVTAITERNDQYVLQPASPQIRLWPDSVQQLGYQVTTLSRVHPTFLKRNWPPTLEQTEQQVVPLRRIYVLEDGDEPAIVPLDAENTFIELMRHMYLSRWPRVAKQQQAQFFQAAALSNQVPVFKLRRPKNFDALPHVLDLLEAAHANVTCD